jgi:hypothetical protein
MICYPCKHVQLACTYSDKVQYMHALAMRTLIDHVVTIVIRLFALQASCYQR